MVLVIKNFEILCREIVHPKGDHFVAVLDYLIHIRCGKIEIVGIGITVYWRIEVQPGKKAPHGSLGNPAWTHVVAQLTFNGEEFVDYVIDRCAAPQDGRSF